MIVSASALVRDCAYPRALKRDKPRSAALEAAGARGTAFHAAVESWVRMGALPVVEDLEIQGWIDLLAANWSPPAGMHTEIAWGLSPEGEHVMVAEPRPHVYEATDGSPLLTAGRADGCWMHRNHQGVLIIVDWKTGAWPAPEPAVNLQVNAAGIALARRFGATAYVPAIYYVRDGFWDIGEVVEMGSLEHAQRLADVRDAALLPEEPRPGDWCANCWERKACPSAPQKGERTP